MKNKILFIVPGYSLGGTTTSLTSMLNCGLSEHFDIDVFAIKRSNDNLHPVVSHDIGLNGLTTAFYGNFSRFQVKDKLKYLPIKLLKRNKSILTILRKWVTLKTIKEIERHKQYDVVVGFQEGLATQFASRFSCKHKIAWIHCDYASTYAKDKDELDLYNHFDKIVCVSQFTRDGFVRRYPALVKKTVAIHNFFDSERIVRLSKEDIDDPRFNRSQFTIISLGRIHEVKQFYLIPEIAAQLKESGMYFRWYILGSSDIPYELQRLTDAIQKNGMEKEVIYLGSKANPYPYLKAANLLVCMSKSEACPMIFNEAKILNVPILSSDFGSVSEFIKDGTTGLITSIEGMQEAIVLLITDEGLRDRIKVDYSFFESYNAKIMRLIKSLFNNESISINIR